MMTIEQDAETLREGAIAAARIWERVEYGPPPYVPALDRILSRLAEVQELSERWRETATVLRTAPNPHKTW